MSYTEALFSLYVFKLHVSIICMSYGVGVGVGGKEWDEIGAVM